MKPTIAIIFLSAVLGMSLYQQNKLRNDLVTSELDRIDHETRLAREITQLKYMVDVLASKGEQ